MSYKWVLDTQAYVSSRVYTEVRPPNCWVSDDAQTYVVGTSSLHVATLRAGMKRIIADIWDQYLRIAGQRFALGTPHDIVDDLSNSTRDYSFLSELPFATHRHDLFHHLVDTYHLCALDSNGRISWNTKAVEGLLDRCANIWRLLSYVQSFFGQISIRLRQYMEYRLVNNDRLRSGIWQTGELLHLLPDHKSSKLTQQDRYLPAFTPAELNEVWFELLGGGLREAEALFVFILEDTAAAHTHRTSVPFIFPLV